MPKLYQPDVLLPSIKSWQQTLKRKARVHQQPASHLAIPIYIFHPLGKSRMILPGSHLSLAKAAISVKDIPCDVQQASIHENPGLSCYSSWSEMYLQELSTDNLSCVACSKITEMLNKKNRSSNVKPFMVKNYLWVFVNCMIENPAFDSQVSSLTAPRKPKFIVQDEMCTLQAEHLFYS